MCACEPGFVCVKCAATPFDDGYVDDDRQVSPVEFERMSLVRQAPEPQMFGGVE